MTTTSARLSSAQSIKVTFEQLMHIRPPAATRSWKPVKHTDFIETMIESLQSRNLQVDTAQYAISPDGLRLFGTFNLADGCGKEYSSCIGFRTSNDKSMPLQAVAGAHVFVCDNMMLSGDVIAFKRRHTSRLDLKSTVRDGIELYLQKQEATNVNIERIRQICLSDDDAKADIYNLLQRKILPSRYLQALHDVYFNKADVYPDVAPRTLWGLNNACTRVAKDMHPQRQFEFTVELGKYCQV